jgi:hypothetical protein
MDDKDNNDIFDKFMEKIVKEEAIKKERAQVEMEESPSRVHQRRYKEHPHNRIVYRR